MTAGTDPANNPKESNVKRVLVTGGAGFIGSHVVSLLLDHGCDVMSYDCLLPQVHSGFFKWPEYQKPQEHLTLHYEDVRNVPELTKALAAFRPDTVIHLAAMVGVAQSNHMIAQYVSDNVTGTACLLDRIADYNQTVRENKARLQAIRECPVGPEPGQTQAEADAKYQARMASIIADLEAKPQDEIEQVLVAGSMSSYGEGAYGLDDEDLMRDLDGVMEFDGDAYVKPPSDFVPGSLTNPDGSVAWDAPGMHPIPTGEHVHLQPESVYSWSKAQQEELALLVGRVRGIAVKVARFFNTYGPNQALSNPYTGIGAIFSARVLAGLNPVVFEDGRQLRDFTHVSDVAEAVLTILDKGEPGEVYNVGTGVPSSVLDVAKALCSDTLCQPDITGVRRVGDIRHCYADASKLRALGWEPKVNLEDGMRMLREWVSTQRPELTAELLDKANMELDRYGLLVMSEPAEDQGQQ
jgi:dTDP-L-rhamnose 4-epimerase